MIVSSKSDSNTRYKLDHKIPVSQAEIDSMYDNITDNIFSGIQSDAKTTGAIESSVPFVGRKTDSVIEEGSKFNTVDKSNENRKSIENEKAEIQIDVEQFNRKVEEALNLETEIKRLGDELGLTKDAVIAAIVDEEDKWYEPGMPGLVRNRQLSKIGEIAAGDGKMKEIQVEYDANLGKLNQVGELVEALREKIKSAFESLLKGTGSKDEVKSLQFFLDGLEIKESKLQILQRDKVESRYKSLKEGLHADCLGKMVGHHRSKVNEGKDSNTQETAKSPDDTRAEFVTFEPTKQPVVEAKQAEEEQIFEAKKDIKLPGLIEGSIQNEQKIKSIQDSIKKPFELPTASPEIEVDQGDAGNPDIVEVSDANGDILRENVNHPQDGAGVELNIPNLS
jgi:hypothetical protein